MTLKSVGILSCGKILGILYAIMGLFVGGIFALISLSGAAMERAEGGDGAAVPFMALGAAAVIILPIMYGVMGFIGGIIMAVIYNVIASLVGGIEMEFDRNPNFD